MECADLRLVCKPLRRNCIKNKRAKNISHHRRQSHQRSLLSKADLHEIRILKSLWLPWIPTRLSMDMLLNAFSSMKTQLKSRFSHFDIVNRNPTLTKSCVERQLYRKERAYDQNTGLKGPYKSKIIPGCQSKIKVNWNRATPKYYHNAQDRCRDLDLNSPNAACKEIEDRESALDLNFDKKSEVQTHRSVDPFVLEYNLGSKLGVKDVKRNDNEMDSQNIKESLKIPKWFRDLCDNGLFLELVSGNPNDASMKNDEMRNLDNKPRFLHIESTCYQGDLKRSIRLGKTGDFFIVTEGPLSSSNNSGLSQVSDVSNNSSGSLEKRTIERRDKIAPKTNMVTKNNQKSFGTDVSGRNKSIFDDKNAQRHVSKGFSAMVSREMHHNLNIGKGLSSGGRRNYTRQKGHGNESIEFNDSDIGEPSIYSKPGALRKNCRQSSVHARTLNEPNYLRVDDTVQCLGYSCDVFKIEPADSDNPRVKGSHSIGSGSLYDKQSRRQKPHSQSCSLADIPHPNVCHGESHHRTDDSRNANNSALHQSSTYVEYAQNQVTVACGSRSQEIIDVDGHQIRPSRQLSSSRSDDFALTTELKSSQRKSAYESKKSHLNFREDTIQDCTVGDSIEYRYEPLTFHKMRMDLHKFVREEWRRAASSTHRSHPRLNKDAECRNLDTNVSTPTAGEGIGHTTPNGIGERPSNAFMGEGLMDTLCSHDTCFPSKSTRLEGDGSDREAAKLKNPQFYTRDLFKFPCMGDVTSNIKQDGGRDEGYLDSYSHYCNSPKAMTNPGGEDSCSLMHELLDRYKADDIIVSEKTQRVSENRDRATSPFSNKPISNEYPSWLRSNEHCTSSVLSHGVEGANRLSARNDCGDTASLDGSLGRYSHSLPYTTDIKRYPCQGSSFEVNVNTSSKSSDIKKKTSKSRKKFEGDKKNSGNSSVKSRGSQTKVRGDSSISIYRKVPSNLDLTDCVKVVILSQSPPCTNCSDERIDSHYNLPPGVRECIKSVCGLKKTEDSLTASLQSFPQIEDNNVESRRYEDYLPCGEKLGKDPPIQPVKYEDHSIQHDTYDIDNVEAQRQDSDLTQLQKSENAAPQKHKGIDPSYDLKYEDSSCRSKKYNSKIVLTKKNETDFVEKLKQAAKITTITKYENHLAELHNRDTGTADDQEYEKVHSVTDETRNHTVELQEYRPENTGGYGQNEQCQTDNSKSNKDGDNLMRNDPVTVTCQREIAKPDTFDRCPLQVSKYKNEIADPQTNKVKDLSYQTNQHGDGSIHPLSHSCNMEHLPTQVCGPKYFMGELQGCEGPSMTQSQRRKDNADDGYDDLPLQCDYQSVESQKLDKDPCSEFLDRRSFRRALNDEGCSPDSKNQQHNYEDYPPRDQLPQEPHFSPCKDFTRNHRNGDNETPTQHEDGGEIGQHQQDLLPSQNGPPFDQWGQLSGVQPIPKKRTVTDDNQSVPLANRERFEENRENVPGTQPGSPGRQKPWSGIPNQSAANSTQEASTDPVDVRPGQAYTSKGSDSLILESSDSSMRNLRLLDALSLARLARDNKAIADELNARAQWSHNISDRQKPNANIQADRRPGGPFNGRHWVERNRQSSGSMNSFKATSGVSSARPFLSWESSPRNQQLWNSYNGTDKRFDSQQEKRVSFPFDGTFLFPRHDSLSLRQSIPLSASPGKTRLRNWSNAWTSSTLAHPSTPSHGLKPPCHQRPCSQNRICPNKVGLRRTKSCNVMEECRRRPAPSTGKPPYDCTTSSHERIMQFQLDVLSCINQILSTGLNQKALSKAIGSDPSSKSTCSQTTDPCSRPCPGLGTPSRLLTSTRTKSDRDDLWKSSYRRNEPSNVTQSKDLSSCSFGKYGGCSNMAANPLRENREQLRRYTGQNTYRSNAITNVHRQFYDTTHEGTDQYPHRYKTLNKDIHQQQPPQQPQQSSRECNDRYIHRCNTFVKDTERQQPQQVQQSPPRPHSCQPYCRHLDKRDFPAYRTNREESQAEKITLETGMQTERIICCKSCCGCSCSANSEEMVKDSQKMVKDSQKMDKDTQKIVSVSQEIDKNSQEMVKDSQKMVKDSQEMVKDSQKMVKDSHEMVKDSQKMIKVSHKMVKNSQCNEVSEISDLTWGCESSRAETKDISSTPCPERFIAGAATSAGNALCQPNPIGTVSGTTQTLVSSLLASKEKTRANKKCQVGRPKINPTKEQAKQWCGCGANTKASITKPWERPNKHMHQWMPCPHSGTFEVCNEVHDQSADNDTRTNEPCTRESTSAWEQKAGCQSVPKPRTKSQTTHCFDMKESSTSTYTPCQSSSLDWERNKRDAQKCQTRFGKKLSQNRYKRCPGDTKTSTRKMVPSATQVTPPRSPIIHIRYRSRKIPAGSSWEPKDEYDYGIGSNEFNESLAKDIMGKTSDSFAKGKSNDSKVKSIIEKKLAQVLKQSLELQNEILRLQESSTGRDESQNNYDDKSEIEVPSRSKIIYVPFCQDETDSDSTSCENTNNNAKHSPFHKSSSSDRPNTKNKSHSIPDNDTAVGVSKRIASIHKSSGIESQFRSSHGTSTHLYGLQYTGPHITKATVSPKGTSTQQREPIQTAADISNTLLHTCQPFSGTYWKSHWDMNGIGAARTFLSINNCLSKLHDGGIELRQKMYPAKLEQKAPLLMMRSRSMKSGPKTDELSRSIKPGSKTDDFAKDADRHVNNEVEYEIMLHRKMPGKDNTLKVTRNNTTRQQGLSRAVVLPPSLRDSARFGGIKHTSISSDISTSSKTGPYPSKTNESLSQDLPEAGSSTHGIADIPLDTDSKTVRKFASQHKRAQSGTGSQSSTDVVESYSQTGVEHKWGPRVDNDKGGGNKDPVIIEITRNSRNSITPSEIPVSNSLKQNYTPNGKLESDIFQPRLSCPKRTMSMSDNSTNDCLVNGSGESEASKTCDKTETIIISSLETTISPTETQIIHSSELAGSVELKRLGTAREQNGVLAVKLSRRRRHFLKRGDKYNHMGGQEVSTGVSDVKSCWEFSNPEGTKHSGGIVDPFPIRDHGPQNDKARKDEESSQNCIDKISDSVIYKDCKKSKSRVMESKPSAIRLDNALENMQSPQNRKITSDKELRLSDTNVINQDTPVNNGAVKTGKHSPSLEEEQEICSKIENKQGKTTSSSPLNTERDRIQDDFFETREITHMSKPLVGLGRVEEADDNKVIVTGVFDTRQTGSDSSRSMGQCQGQLLDFRFVIFRKSHLKDECGSLELYGTYCREMRNSRKHLECHFNKRDDEVSMACI